MKLFMQKCKACGKRLENSTSDSLLVNGFIQRINRVSEKSEKEYLKSAKKIVGNGHMIRHFIFHHPISIDHFTLLSNRHFNILRSFQYAK